MVNKYLRRCFDLARLGNGFTSPNPSVGSVIVDTADFIVGEGFHQHYGMPHAEVNAVESALKLNNDLSKMAIFVSLEPCFHYGKTPPCVNLILEKGFKQVSIAAIDPNPKVSGKSIKKFRSNKINIRYDDNFDNKKNNDVEHYIDETLTPFFINIKYQRPFIILKWAESQDGYIGLENEKLQISNEFSKRLVHKWRSSVDAIMVGTNTAQIDNPELSNRFYYGKSPIRVILDKNGRLPDTLNIFDDSLDTIVFSEQTDLNIHSKKRVKHHKITFDDILLPNLLHILHQEKIGILMIEGGAQLLSSFIEKGLWDRAYVIKSPKILRGGVAAPNLSETFFTSEEKLGDNIVRYFKIEK